MNAKLLLATLACLLALPAANAIAGHYEQSQHLYPAELKETSVSPQVFTSEGLTVSCPKAVYTGKLSEAQENVNVIPKYEGECTATEGELKTTAIVKATNCEYQFHVGELLEIVKTGTKEAGSETKNFSGEAGLVNGGGACALVLETKTGCKVVLGAQETKAKTVEKSKHTWFPFAWSNEKSASYAALRFTVSGLCAGVKTGEHSNGVLKSTMLSGPNFEIN